MSLFINSVTSEWEKNTRNYNSKRGKSEYLNTNKHVDYGPFWCSVECFKAQVKVNLSANANNTTLKCLEGR